MRIMKAVSMPRFLSLLVFFWFAMPSDLAWGVQKPNILLICVDDLRPELGCYGANSVKTPNIDLLAARGRIFTHHYVQAPTCGASRCALLTGRYGPAGNEALMQLAKRRLAKPESVPPSLPEYFRSNGYTTVSVGKVSHYPGGRGGPDWDDDSIHEMPGAWTRHLMPTGPWKHPRGAMHGLANGEVRSDKPNTMAVFQSVSGEDDIYPDGLIVNETLNQLDELTSDDAPFFLAIGLIRPHLPFGAPKTYYDLVQGLELPSIPHPGKPSGKTTWHGSGEFRRYDLFGKDPNQDRDFADEVRRHYSACVAYADANVGRVLEKLNATGKSKETIILLWGDHGWHLGEHAIWGKHSLFEESLRSPLVISYEGLQSPGGSCDAVVETIDLFPTLCDLSGLDVPATPGHPAISYTPKAASVRTDHYRLIQHKSGEIELYDETSPEAETLNIADAHPDVVDELTDSLEARGFARPR